jgi:nucleotide-binding universal stress UspA family protein
MEEDVQRRDAWRGALPRNVLLATDLSCRCDRALDRAVMLASAWGARLHVIHVLEGEEPDQGAEPLPGRSARALAERQLRAATRDRGIEAELVIEHGNPAEVILRKAAEIDCDLVVTGIARSGTLARAVLGTTVERLVHRAPMPVLVVKTRPWRAYQKVVVASDFSVSAAHALREAVRMFPETHVTLAHAYRVPFEGFISRKANEEELLADAQHECAAFLPSLGAPPDVLARMDCLIRYGSPESVVGTHVWEMEVDLTVMGTHGRSGSFGILMGSTAERLLAYLPCDVLVVREPRAVTAGDTSASRSTSSG